MTRYWSATVYPAVGIDRGGPPRSLLLTISDGCHVAESDARWVVAALSDAQATTAGIDEEPIRADERRKVAEEIASAIEQTPGADEGPYMRDCAAIARTHGATR